MGNSSSHAAQANESATSSDASSTIVTAVSPVDLLVAACGEDDETQVLELLKQHGQAGILNAVDTFDYTPLMAACGHGNLGLARVLVHHGALINATDAEGRTALHIAAQNGHTSVVVQLLSRGANVEAANVNGASSLFVASQNGHLSVVIELLSRGANVEAAMSNGASPLFVASQNDHLSVVIELLSRGADVLAVYSSGATPLHAAARHCNIDIVALLLERSRSLRCADLLLVRSRDAENADTRLSNMLTNQRQHADSVFGSTGTEEEPALQSCIGVTQTATLHASAGELLEIADAQGYTVVLAAARLGHFEVVQYLMNNGSSVHARTRDGETILVSAARWRNLSIISQLFELGWLTPRATSDERVPLLMATLQTLKDYTSQLHEYQQMWLRVVDRLVDIHDRIAESPDSPRDAVFQFGMIVFHVIRLKAASVSSNVFARLVASPTIAIRFRDFHTELTYLEEMLSPGSFESLRMEWEIKCEKDEVVLLGLFQAKIGDSAENFDWSVRSEDDQLESSCLLQHKVRAQGESCSPDLKRLLDLSLRKLRDANAELTPVPEWFIPPHELDVNETGDSHTAATTIQSKWTSSAVMISQHRMPRGKFIATVETCFQLSHPNVVKVFGASHLRSPFLAVFENAPSTSLREYLARDENKHLLWQKLYEVSLGLKYLIERGVIIGNLRCDSIWVGTDGLAKINALHCVASQEDPSSVDEQRVRWQAPEVLRGELPSVASSIYSLGMCIWEASTGEVPWVDDTSEWVSMMVLYNYRPQLPEGMRSAQSYLLESMWRADLSKRPTISSVVLQLKQFADDQISELKFLGRTGESVLSGNRFQSQNLEQFIFPDFESTINGFLDRLKQKCSHCREYRDDVLHIFERMRDVYGLLQTQHRLPSDIAVVSYCELLLRLDHFLRIAVDVKSVLLQAKSQRVALQSNEFHRRLDELLEFLAPQITNPIHLWLREERTESNHTVRVLTEAYLPSSDPDSPATMAAEQDGPVTIERFNSERVNEKFKEFDLAVIHGTATTNKEAPRPPWLIHTYDLKYNKSDQIGVGAFGEVYKATWLGTPVVIKFMGYEADEDAYSREMFFHELRVWFPLSHPHVVKLYGASHIGKRFFVCEFVGNGTLDEYLKREGNSDKSWQLLYQVGLGLQHLHENNILHNDLKCDNVLIGSNGDAKIADFGLSSILNNAEVKIDPKKQGAVHWRSPEYLRGDRLTLTSDIYSFGMLILEAMTGETPWGSLSAASVRYQLLKKGGFPLRPDCLSDSQWNLIKMMCAAAPSQRVQISFVADKLHELGQQQQLQSGQKESPSIVLRPSGAP